MRYVTFDQLRNEYGLPWSRTHVRRLERAARFPASVRIGYRTSVWDAKAVEAWIDARTAQRDGGRA